MHAVMAPPSKRRKLEDTNTEMDTVSLVDDSIVCSTNIPHPHTAEAPSTHLTPGPPWPTSSGDTVQLTRTVYPAAGGIEDFKVLLPRSGTLLSSAEPALSSLVFDASSLVSDVESNTITVAASVSLPTDIVVTDEATVTAFNTSSNGAATATASSALQTSSDTSHSLISTNSLPPVNGTSTSGPTSTFPSSALTSFSGNLTTSVPGSVTSSRTTSSRSGVTSVASSNLSAIYLATLPNGYVTTLLRHDGAYTTTLPDGETLTIPAMSTRASSSSTTNTAVLTTTVYDVTSIPASGNLEPSTITSVATVGGAGNIGPSYTTPAPTSTASSGDEDGNNQNTPPAGTIAGGVVGGAAGLAVVVFLAMLFFRWYQRKSRMGRHILPAESLDSPDGDGAPDTSRAPGMAERAGLMPIIASLPAFSRHRNRSTEGSDPSERGFTRVSGRKLPSAFSEGMTSEGMAARGMNMQSPQPQMALMSSSAESDAQHTYYRDSDASFGAGEGVPFGSSDSPDAESAMRNSVPDEFMTVSPGPQRQPQIHSGGPYFMSTHNDDVPATATFDRSETPSTLRNSRFAEDM